MVRRLWFVLAMLSLGVPAAAQNELPAIEIGVILDGPGPLNEPVLRVVRESVRELTEGSSDVRFSEAHRREGDWSTRQAASHLDELLADPDVDIILAMGVLASYDAVSRGSLPKPVLAPFVLNFEREGVPLEGDHSGVRNLSYLVLPRTFRRDVAAFADIVSFSRLAILFSEPIASGLPRLRPNLEELVRELGFGVQSIEVARDVPAALQEIADDVDAVFVMPQVHLPAAGMQELAEGLIQRGLPSFSMLGRRDVEGGILASLNPDIFDRLARRIALHVHNALLGDPLAEMNVVFAAGERLTLNVRTAERLGLALGWGALTQADLVGETTSDVTRTVSLTGVVPAALAANRDLLARRREVLSGAQNEKIARSALLPQVDIAGRHLTIDDDRASPFGTAERTLTGSASVTQLLWSEAAWADRSIQKSLQETRVQTLRQNELDVAQGAATAYLNVLKASSLEEIQRQNLQLTRSNLELAEVRELIGQSGPAETLRLESQLASNTRDAIAANARRNVAEIELNRILNRPLEEPFRTEERNLVGALGVLAAEGVTRFFQSKRAFAAFRDFMVGEGLDAAPELAGIDAALAAQDRLASSVRRGFWSPTLALQGDVAHRFDESGAGTDPPPAAFGLDPDETDWSVALALSFPLFESGRKFAVLRQANEELARLRGEREAAAERIEQRVRTALHLAGASYAGIEQAQRAAAAAQRSLEVVVDSYGQGLATLLDLLDAQTNALVADEQAATAIFDFFLDLVEVQRALGAHLVLLDDAERAALLTEADAFVGQRLGPAWRR